MKPEFQVCTLADVEALKAVSLSTFLIFKPYNKVENYDSYVNEAFSTEQLSREIQNPDSLFYFIKLENKVIGYFKLNKGKAQQEDFGEDSVELQRLYLEKEYRGRGYGDLMLEKSLEQAKEWKKKFVWLGVWDRNPRAVQFYQENGFEIFSAHNFPFGDELQRDLLLKKYVD